MEKDKTIQRIREARHLISEEFGHDPFKLVEHYKKYQEKLKSRLIRKPALSADSVQDKPAKYSSD